MKKLMLCALLGGIAMSCHAAGADWQYLGGYSDGSLKIYGDANSLNKQKHTGMTREVSSYANGKRLNTAYKMYQADCQHSRYRVTAFNGKPIDGVWNDVNPGSTGDATFRWLCGK